MNKGEGKEKEHTIQFDGCYNEGFGTVTVTKNYFICKSRSGHQKAALPKMTTTLEIFEVDELLSPTLFFRNQGIKWVFREKLMSVLQEKFDRLLALVDA